jgi:hypothetical protein
VLSSLFWQASLISMAWFSPCMMEGLWASKQPVQDGLNHMVIPTIAVKAANLIG